MKTLILAKALLKTLHSVPLRRRKIRRRIRIRRRKRRRRRRRKWRKG